MCPHVQIEMSIGNCAQKVSKEVTKRVDGPAKSAMKCKVLYALPTAGDVSVPTFLLVSLMKISKKAKARPAMPTANPAQGLMMSASPK